MEAMFWVVGGLWVMAGSLFAAARQGARADAERLGLRPATGEAPDPCKEAPWWVT